MAGAGIPRPWQAMALAVTTGEGITAVSTTAAVCCFVSDGRGVWSGGVAENARVALELSS